VAAWLGVNCLRVCLFWCKQYQKIQFNAVLAMKYLNAEKVNALLQHEQKALESEFFNL